MPGASVTRVPGTGNLDPGLGIQALRKKRRDTEHEANVRSSVMILQSEVPLISSSMFFSVV